jgi:hypothetical protein
MISSAIPDIIDVVLFVVTFIITARALYLYVRVRAPRIFILGLSMLLIALTGVADFVSAHATIPLHTDWFLYIGQAIAFLFILLSLLYSSEMYQQSLMRWHIILFIASLALMLLSLILPDISSTVLRTVLSGSRCILCFAIFFYYALTFASKQARFSLLMSVAFLFLSFGYLIILFQYFSPQPQQLDNIGDLMRIGGFIALLIAVIAG